jgi:hypothetical protein
MNLENILKKLIFLTINMFLIGFCYGQLISQWDIELSSGYSFYTISNDNEYTINNGFPFGISCAFYVDDRFGVGIYSNFIYIPKSVGTDTVEGSSIKNGGNNFLFGFDFLVGPIILLYNTDKIKIPFSIGIHFNLFMAFCKVKAPDEYNYLFPGKAELEYSEVNYGIGFNIGIEYHFSKRVYILSRIQGSFDFINIITSEMRIPTIYGTYTKKDRNFGISNAWGFIHHVGIGLYF